MSKIKILCHIVFATKAREHSINPEYRKELYAYIHGILKNKKCALKRINGITDHIHMLIELHPTIALADLMRDVKGGSSVWLSNNSHFMKFKGWGRGYYAASIGINEMEACRQYIINQENHHTNQDLLSELEHMIRCIELEWYPDEWN